MNRALYTDSCQQGLCHIGRLHNLEFTFALQFNLPDCSKFPVNADLLCDTATIFRDTGK